MRNITVLIFAVTAPAAGAQSPIPIRTIGPILATSTENVGQAVTIRATSDGHVIVGAGARQKVYAFDSTLKSFTIVVDSGAGTGQIPIRTTGVIPYLADSTLLPDFSANALLVLDATGKQIRFHGAAARAGSHVPRHPSRVRPSRVRSERTPDL
jgi:hypothetical protein